MLALRRNSVGLVVVSGEDREVLREVGGAQTTLAQKAAAHVRAEHVDVAEDRADIVCDHRRHGLCRERARLVRVDLERTASIGIVCVDWSASVSIKQHSVCVGSL